MSEQPRICGNCKWYDKGQCHRNAPIPGILFNKWPIVTEDEWCGEYESPVIFLAML